MTSKSVLGDDDEACVGKSLDVSIVVVVKNLPSSRFGLTPIAVGNASESARTRALFMLDSLGRNAQLTATRRVRRGSAYQAR